MRILDRLRGWVMNWLSRKNKNHKNALPSPQSIRGDDYHFQPIPRTAELWMQQEQQKAQQIVRQAIVEGQAEKHFRQRQSVRKADT